MPSDIKVIDFVDGVIVPETWPNPAYVAGLYNLIQRIYKCMFTEVGDDEDDPTFGGGIRSTLGPLQGPNNDQATQAAQQMLKKIKADLSGNTSTDPAEQLKDLVLNSIEYDTDATAWRLSITVVSASTQATISASNA